MTDESAKLLADAINRLAASIEDKNNGGPQWPTPSTPYYYWPGGYSISTPHNSQEMWQQFTAPYVAIVPIAAKETHK